MYIPPSWDERYAGWDKEDIREDIAVRQDVLKYEMIYAPLIIVCALFSFFGHDEAIWVEYIDMDCSECGNCELCSDEPSDYGNEGLTT